MQLNRTENSQGLRVITIPMADNPTVTVFVLAAVGSMAERKEISGISHFLEHMCFKGTEKRPKAIDITRELDSIGAQYNAFTSHEYTGYYAHARAKHLPEILDVVSDIYLNSTFPEAEITKEKGVIIEEINMYEDMPHRNVHDIYLELLYGDTPAGWNIAGTKETVASLTREALSKYYHEHYTAGNTVVIVAGGFNEDDVRAEIEKVFAKMPEKKTDNSQQTTHNSTQKSPQVKIKFRKTDQAHMVLGFRTFDTYDPRNYQLEVLATILGGGMSSRLFQELREERGLGYYVSAHRDAYTDHGNLAISAGVTISKVEEAIQIILKECQKLKTESVSEEELNRVKEFITGNMFLELESSEDIGHFYGVQEILKKPLRSAFDIEQKIREVTAADIQKLAQEIFVNEKMNLAVVGPYEKAEVFEKLLMV